MPEITPQFLEQQAARLLTRAAAAHRKQPPLRFILAVAGIPAAGKSTLVAQLHQTLERQAPGRSVVVPMDGFHYPNAELEARSLRHVKGSPATFDVKQYIALLERLRDATTTATFPIYDRQLHNPVWRDRPEQTISRDIALIITEGNYLLLREEPWNRLADLFDEAWFLDTPADTARQWLLHRHIQGGRRPTEAQAHINRSDAHNTDLIRQSQRPANLVVTWPQEG